eukprot:4907290-Pyramimonas_sp.AAC.1
MFRRVSSHVGCGEVVWAFANDVAAVIKYRTMSFSCIGMALREYARTSGLELNIQETAVIPFYGRLLHRQTANTHRRGLPLLATNMRLIVRTILGI